EGYITKLEQSLADKQRAKPVEPTPPPPKPPVVVTPPPPTPMPPPTVQPAPAGVVVKSPPPRRTAEPVYTKWWLWPVGGVAAAAGVGGGLGVGLSQQSDVTIPPNANTVQF